MSSDPQNDIKSTMTRLRTILIVGMLLTSSSMLNAFPAAADGGTDRWKKGE